MYSSAKSSTVMQLKKVPSPPPGFEGTYDTRPYDMSGWCIFEESSAQLVAGTEAVIVRRLELLREPLRLLKAYLGPLLHILLVAMGGESGLSHESVQSEEELAMRDLVAGVDALTRPKLIDVSIPDRPREIKLCVLLCSVRVCV